uniref:Uroporphyrinogen-III synthase n=1 Tax=Phallusia mammillata TaxID=59560 RepID=A0A6F9DX39_9ASCI|nr:uroporphyrinogen-III synthase-like [Phallusia mammillata]
MKVVLMRSSVLPVDPYHDALNSISHVVSIPVLTFSFINAEKLYEKITQPDKYSGIIMTSKRAGEAIQAVLGEFTVLPDRWRHKPCYVVGESTAEIAKNIGFETKGKESGNAENLAQIIISSKADVLVDCPLLFVCGHNRRETLSKILLDNGQLFEILEAYNSIADPFIAENIEKYCTKFLSPDYIVYFSPMGYKFSFNVWKQILGDLMSTVKHFLQTVAIGKTTADSLKHEDIPIIVACKPSAPYVRQAIEEDVKTTL